MPKETVSFRQQAMAGLRNRFWGMTEYHRNKVGKITVIRNGKRESITKSTFPPEDVWAREDQETILRSVNQLQLQPEYPTLSLVQQLRQSLQITTEHWQDRNILNHLHDNWETWKNESESQGRYPAGGWAASPEQFSQLLAVIQVIDTNQNLHRVLRLGTASGVHTEQELLALYLGLSNPSRLQHTTEDRLEFDVIDAYRAPLRDTRKVISPDLNLHTRRASALHLPKHALPWNRTKFPSDSVDLVTTSFIESFIPTEPEFRNNHMTHSAGIALKERLFTEAKRVLRNGGVFTMTIGTEQAKQPPQKDPRRFQNKEELQRSLVQAGFHPDKIIITPTTDPLDFENGQLSEGNYFVVAIKDENR